MIERAHIRWGARLYYGASTLLGLGCSLFGVVGVVILHVQRGLVLAFDCSLSGATRLYFDIGNVYIEPI